MDKSPDAFRTISEVAEFLETPAHVLRFWESRFPQIRPVKRAGGRRYYRPADVALLTGIKRLLHDEGLTIRGVQKILREHGVRHVAGLSGDDLASDADMDAEAALEAALALNFDLDDDNDLGLERTETATIVTLDTALRRSEPSEPVPVVVEEDVEITSVFASDSDDISPKLLAEPEMASLIAAVRQHEVSLAADASLPARLGALPPAAFLHRQPELRALRDRLLALRARLVAAPDLSASSR